MKLNKIAIKNTLNYVIEKQTFDFDDGKMSTIYLTSIVKDLTGNDESKMQEVACAIVRCINEGLMISNYPRTSWDTAEVIDVTFRGFAWLENN